MIVGTLEEACALADAAGHAQVVGFDADGCLLCCCDPHCLKMLVLAWSQRQVDEAKEKAREAGWFIWSEDEPLNRGRVYCPDHNAAVRS